MKTTHITILTSCIDQPLTKRLSAGPDGKIVKTQAVMPRYFKALREPVGGFWDLAAVLTKLVAEKDRFVIRGEPRPGIDTRFPVRRLKYDGSVSPATFRSSPKGQHWVCMDFDKVPCPAGIDPVAAPQDALLFLSYLLPEGFHDVSFWWQWSSSAGLDGWKTLSAHLWFWLDRPATDDELQAWAADHPSTPIDRRLFNCVQPHFTASPIISTGVTDPCPKRHGVVRGQRFDYAFLNLQQSRAAA